MKNLFLSDLHNEFAVFEPPKIKADIIVLTGDIDLGSRGAFWSMEKFGNIPIIYISGNHEYYGHKLPEVNAELSKISKSNSNFYFLENESLILNGIRFLGCTLWTDFLLFGKEYLRHACYTAENGMSDYFRIRLGAADLYRKLCSSDVIRIHKESIRFLEKHLSQNYSGNTIVLSHHAPLKNSVPEKYSSDLLSCAFANNLENLLSIYKPEFWLHGHTHFNVDYVFDQTRIISNQRGYFPMELVIGFKKNYVIEVG